MLPGVSGHLISEALLERHALDPRHVNDADSRHARSRLIEWRRQSRWLGPASGLRSLLEAGAQPLIAALGFQAPDQVDVQPEGVVASIGTSGDLVGLVVTRWAERLDPLWRLGVVEARRRGARWVVLFSGTHLRLVETALMGSRRYLEIDLDAALDDDRTFAALWTVFRASSFGPVPGGRASWLHGVVRESERYAVGVCRSLRDGVLQASSDVVNALVRPRGPGLADSFEQALTIVYRILFLLFAEARGLVPLWHPVYRESYSIEAVRDAAEHSPPTPGLWDALRASCRLAHAGCRAGDLRVTAFNGRLFSPSGTPLADRRDLDDEYARGAVIALSTRPAIDGAGRERIAYRELGVEQLGAVYESLLDYVPKATTRVADRVRPLSAVALVAGSGVRKSTGTFYTPQPLAHYLVRQTLGPLVRDATPERILGLRVLDPAMGSGAFLVAACGFLAQAYEEAVVSSGGCHPSDIGPHEQQLIRRTVAERCLYGVDLNPMATQLARLSLWLATLAADRPLSFLDHHLTTGDSLLGTWLTALRRPPGAVRQPPGRLPLFDADDVGTALRAALPIRFSLSDEPNDTAEQVRAKERALSALNGRDSALARWRRVADLWCSHWFTPGGQAGTAFGALADAVLAGRSALPDATVRDLLARTEAVAGRRRFFHWELEFPEVFFDAAGRLQAAPGFDAVIGNPPWDMIRADAGASDARADGRTDEACLTRFARDAGVYISSTSGHANRYQLFLERAMTLARPGGRIGLVLPAGLASDHGSAPLRRLLFSRCAVEALVGFDNRLGVFPIHRSVRFLLMTATSGTPTTRIACRLGETDPEGLAAAGPADEDTAGWFPIRLTPALLERLSGPDVAVPDLRSPLDLTLAERAAALFPPLGSADGWSARFGRELNATDDRGCFQSPARRGVPVVEGKQIAPFQTAVADSRWTVTRQLATARLAGRFDRARLGYRDVASATNRVTLIAAILPAGCVTTHTVFCLRTPLTLRAQHFLCGLFNSLVLNYLVRQRVTTHVTTGIVERLPVPRRDQAGAAFGHVAALARVLARRPDPGAAARLHAAAARLYRLSRDEFAHVLGTFPLVPPAERRAALEAYTHGGSAT